MSSPTQNQLRAELKNRRQQLSSQQLQCHSQQARRNLNKLSHRLHIKKHSKIALYMPSSNEISPVPHSPHNTTFKFYLPKISQQQLQFHRQRNFSTGLTKHRWGILEPNSKKQCKIKDLSIIVMPLVAFDNKGNRIGMGGGFYDRSLAFTKHSWHRKTVLIGFSHDFQELNKIEANTWDIACDYIVTNKKIFDCKRERKLALARKLTQKKR